MKIQRVAVIIPDRGDRPKFLQNCLRMISEQTMPVDEVLLMNYKPESDKTDLTQRYRRGYDKLRGKGYDCILFMENDDWYSPDYVDTMVNGWIDHGKPQIFGTNYTIYYNININAWFTYHHKRRSSAMSTLIVPDLEIDWCDDSEVFTDLHLWMRSKLNGVTFKPDKHICMGIKHGVGLCGGRSHVTRMHLYENFNGLDLLKETLDPTSYEFYTTYYD